MFTAIAPTYDRLNRIISFRFDQRWRRAAVRRLGWERRPTGVYLDLCAGTMDFGATLARQRGFGGRIVAADFAQAMLRLGRTKSGRLRPVTADALELPFPDAAFDGAMVGWGVRNLMDLDAGLAEANLRACAPIADDLETYDGYTRFRVDPDLPLPRRRAARRRGASPRRWRLFRAVSARPREHPRVSPADGAAGPREAALAQSLLVRYVNLVKLPTRSSRCRSRLSVPPSFERPITLRIVALVVVAFSAARPRWA
jgi:hypothetical protein